ncbi:MAG: type II toxin-antitoxin system VapC family toxin [Candidatus Promineofilum sp.]|nr:type II toxin-antitoxin system VapC family toxin [Promineifilum sp.]
MIITDTNVIAYLLLTGEYSAQAEKALRLDPVWAAPILWRSEFRNVLALYIRKKSLTVGQAIQIFDRADALLDGREYTLSSRSVLELVARSNCSAYDCEFVALAQDLGVSMVTVDKRIPAQFPDVAVSLVDYIA